MISNSEVGHGSFSVTPQITIQVCDNGMTFTRDAMREVHLGGRLDAGVIRWSSDTHDAALDLVDKQLRFTGEQQTTILNHFDRSRGGRAARGHQHRADPR
ncbi:MAG: hypothetical protein ACRDTA_19725 [Pseudonocardiaceae bacterium]